MQGKKNISAECNRLGVITLGSFDFFPIKEITITALHLEFVSICVPTAPQRQRLCFAS